MLKQSRKAVAVGLVLVLVIGLAAYAQTRPAPKGPREKPAGRMPLDAELEAIKGFPILDDIGRPDGFYRLVCLQRHLLPPAKRELARLITLLGLTDQQKEQLRQLYIQFRDKVKPVLDQRAGATKEVFTLLQSQSPSKEALHAAAARVSQCDTQILNAEFDFWLAFRTILNPQQQQALSQFIQQKSQPGIGIGGPGKQPGRPFGPPPPQK